MHLQGEEWIAFDEGHEAAALESAISPLQRYFFRPQKVPYIQLRYHKYFEDFVVSKTCPDKLQWHFPGLFPDAKAPHATCTDNIWTDPSNQAVQHDVPPTLDEAPAGSRHFVYLRTRGEHPLCRLEMKFPRQKEVFYLRLILLHFPKLSFDDCYRHGNNGRYASHEEAVVASGLLQATDESHAVMRELIAPRYAAAQLRFAFVVLLEQDAKPGTLFEHVHKDIMKDFQDRGSPHGGVWRLPNSGKRKL